MPALFAGARIDAPMIGGHTYQMLVDGKRVFLPPEETVVSLRIVQSDGTTVPESLPIDGTLALAVIPTYGDGHDGEITTDDVVFSVRDTSVATISANTLAWVHGGVAVVSAFYAGVSSMAVGIDCAYAPEQIIVTPSEVSLRVGGDPVELSVTVLPAEADQTVTVSVEPEGIVEVTPLENPGGGA